jgi:hypothetical protein
MILRIHRLRSFSLAICEFYVLVACIYELKRVVAFSTRGDDLNIMSIHNCSFGHILATIQYFDVTCFKLLVTAYGWWQGCTVVGSGTTLEQRQGQELRGQE